jgi:hypothetical protein
MDDLIYKFTDLFTVYLKPISEICVLYTASNDYELKRL